MDPTEDADLLWIADEALTAGEPEASAGQRHSSETARAREGLAESGGKGRGWTRGGREAEGLVCIGW
eukprot:4695988-Pleurochrysis_carterae.AAC.1